VSRSTPIQYGAAGPHGAAASSASATVWARSLEPVGQVQVGAEPGLVEPFVDGANLPAQVGELRGQGGQALAQSAG
jgi:hypothetical protein